MYSQSGALAWGRGGRKGVPPFKQRRKNTYRHTAGLSPETCNPTILILRIKANRSFLCKFIHFNKSFIVLNYLLGDSFLLVLFLI